MPEGEDRLVIIRCGDKSIDVHITRTRTTEGQEFVGVEESLETD